MPSVGARATSGNSKDVMPFGAVIRHTAVPGRVSAPIFSQTKRCLPPAVACVRETRSVGRLQETFVASRSCPESSSMTSGVNPNHQFGGSTFVTFTVEAAGLCFAAGEHSTLSPFNRQASPKRMVRQEFRLDELFRRGEKGFFTGRA